MAKPIGRFRVFVQEEVSLLSLIASALASASGQKRLAQALYDLDAADATEEKRQSLAADRDRQIAFAEAAEKEVQIGFPRLCAHTAVAIWSALEVMVEDTIVAALLTDLEKADAERLDRIRLPFGQFERVDRDERLRAVAGQLLQDESTHGGVNRFERALDVVSLTGPLDEADSHMLWELQNIRNAIVHNGGIADQRLVQRIPWLGAKRGDEVIVTLEKVHEYATAAAHYAHAVRERIRNRYGEDAPPDEDSATPTTE